MPRAGDERWKGRRQAREAALRMLYQTEVGRMPVADAISVHGELGGADAIGLDPDAQDYAVALAQGSWDAREVIDGYIADAARNWRVERLSVIDRLLLRLATHELLDHPATPPRVVIDEAIELARAYSGEEAARFVNGVLDGLFKRLKDEGKVVD
jgi:N utilization substance protein B